MARPSKPAAVIVAEGKSHRTKAEIKAREAAEKSVLSGKPLYERPSVKKNKAAHAEFRRVLGLMRAIGKDDALYSSGLNTYCQLFAEISEMEQDKVKIDEVAETLDKRFEELENLEYEQAIAFEKAYTQLVSQKLALSAAIDKKRKMMLDIDKENVMTISAALRSIPKAPEKEENPLLKVLMEDDDE